MSKYRLPSDARLEHLIRESFEHMPGPQMARFDQIEQRLKPVMSRRIKKVNKTPWWIVLLLTGGFAMAAWWAGETYLPDSSMDAQTEIESSIFGSDAIFDPKVSPAENGVSAPEPEFESGRESPIIYQRESLEGAAD